KERARDANYRKQPAGKVLRSDAKPLTDEDLIAKLRSFGIEFGADDILLKPVRHQALGDALRRWMPEKTGVGGLAGGQGRCRGGGQGERGRRRSGRRPNIARDVMYCERRDADMRIREKGKQARRAVPSLAPDPWPLAPIAMPSGAGSGACPRRSALTRGGQCGP